jgi:hypothetical protein
LKDLNIFISIFQGMPADQIVPNVNRFPEQWSNAWVNTNQLSVESISLLATTMCRIPHSVLDFTPPPISVCSDALQSLLERLQNDEAYDEEDLLRQVEVTVKMVERLLKFTWDSSRESVKSGLDDILSAASSCLVPKIPAHRKMQTTITHWFEELEKEWVVKVRKIKLPKLVSVLDDDENVEGLASYAAWKGTFF